MKTTLRKTLVAALLTSILGAPVVSIAADWFGGERDVPTPSVRVDPVEHHGLTDLEMNQ